VTNADLQEEKVNSWLFVQTKNTNKNKDRNISIPYAANIYGVVLI
jgi:hypothetical protein